MSLQDIADTFDMLGDWEERYRYLLDLGKQLEPFPEPEKTDDSIVRGCMSQVWMDHRVENGRLHFRGDSDAHIVRGLIALLFALVQDRRPQEILDTDIRKAFADLGLENHISMNRRNGFYAMSERIRAAAQAAAAG
ncbi:SufE family protein [Flagellatimonas centrodinii]|uniref:SufE family protein n=1 Tax=Flagellatimonas centrodinii TaxID=2806210 RepID=UPI001FEE46CB|nr:SufE family protein [Flagellatimonas centrodinii]ULQ47925.1 SufE family protein [Flagellatimonas centrodinii]